MLRPGDEIARRDGRPGPPGSARTGLSGLNTSDIVTELARRQRRLPSLLSRRDRLLAELARVEAEITELGGVAGEDDGASLAQSPRPSKPEPAARKRTRLGDALAAVVELHANVVPKEALHLLKESGYPMTKSLLTRLTATLGSDERFSRVERGKYERVR